MRRYRRYVYDLTDIIEGLRLAAHNAFSHAQIEAWILEELRRAYKVQNVWTDDIQHQSREVVTCLAWGRYRQSVLRGLLELFAPMSHEFYEADYAELDFRQHVLTVALYHDTHEALGWAWA